MYTTAIPFLTLLIQWASDFFTRNFELVKMKCGDITADDIRAVDGVFLKYL